MKPPKNPTEKRLRALHGGRDIPGFTRPPTAKELGEELVFRYEVTCYCREGYLHWCLPVLDRRAVKLIKLLWCGTPGNRCKVAKKEYRLHEFYCRWVKFRRDGKLYLKTFFPGLPEVIWLYLWEVRGAAKGRNYQAEEEVKPRDLRLGGAPLGTRRMCFYDLDGRKLTKPEAKAAKKLKTERLPW